MSSNAPAKAHSPIPDLLLGGFVTLLSIGASCLQIATSEAFMMNGAPVSLKPDFAILWQVPEFFQGTIDPNLVPAFMWGFGVEAIFLICVLGFDLAHGTIKANNSVLARVFLFGMIGCIALNGWSDFKYGVAIRSGTWGHIAFALITSFMVAFFGIVGVKFLERGVKEWGR